MRLAALQSSLLRAATGRDECNEPLLRSIRADARAPVAERIAAYRANIRGAHLQALDSAFPVTREVLGPKYWGQLLESDVKASASASSDLNAYGGFVPALLATAQQHRPELRELPYLEELATLEWAVHRARFAADDPDFDWPAFAALSDEDQAQLQFLLSNALQVLRLQYPVDDIWRAHNGHDGAPNAQADTIACCVHRAGRFDVEVSRMQEQDYALFETLPDSRLGELSGTGNVNDELVQRIFGWIRRGWITGFRTA
jgi:hypothetical protein